MILVKQQLSLSINKKNPYTSINVYGFFVYMAPQTGLEPVTPRLTAECSTIELLRIIGSGSDLLSQAVSHQVPSALKGLTSVFGMGTGVTLSLLPPEKLLKIVPSKLHNANLLLIKPSTY